jgi:outer membrane receptor protein involved in Fe transport
MDNSLRDFVYKVNTSYQFERADALLFATIAEGYRPGGANFFNASQGATVDPRFFGYDPDKVTSYELGIKSMWLDDRLRLNTSVYHIAWEGIQLGTRIGEGWPAIVNGDDARINGIEVDLTALLTNALQLDLSIAKLDAQLTEDTLTTPEVDGQKGDRLPGSADFQAFLALRYETEFGNAVRWWVRAAGSYSSDVTSYLNDNQFNQLITPIELSENRFFDRMPSYTIWNLSTGIERDQWSLLVHIDNLFNKKYIVASSTFELGPVDDPVSRQHYYGYPRTVGASLRYTF